MEAATQAWSNFSLTAVYIMIWLIYFVETLLAGITLALVPYVTSAFSMHAFTPTVSILSNIFGGAITLSIAKIIDNLWATLWLAILPCHRIKRVGHDDGV
jgi:hypothetical protein